MPRTPVKPKQVVSRLDGKSLRTSSGDIDVYIGKAQKGYIAIQIGIGQSWTLIKLRDLVNAIKEVQNADTGETTI